MDPIKTTTEYYLDEAITCLAEPEKYPLHRIKGHNMTEDGYLNGRSSRYVRVTPDGRAWNGNEASYVPYPYELDCERWVDMERIGNFSPDAGEFERCGIIPRLCGSLETAC